MIPKKLRWVSALMMFCACHIPGPLPFSTGPELPSCGDLVVDPEEMCDDGSRNNDQWGDCTEQCTIPVCGDGLVHEPTEQCDLGSENAEQSPCLPDCTLPASCGDGIVHPLEGCDLGEENSDTVYGEPGCSLLCHPISYCGDGSIDADYESCDDGNDDNNDSCTNDCQENVCGDGFVYAGFEDCDDANADNSDDCLDTCTLASCGDGHVQVGVEECDGQADCGPLCYRDRYVFTTEKTFRGDFGDGIGDTGIERADWLCRTWAQVAGLHGGSQYKAWLSDDTTTPAERFFHSPGRYVFPDGSVFAESWDELIAGNILEAPDWTETMGKPSDETVWSNSFADGTRVSETDHCNRWSSWNEGVGRIGGSSFEDEQWAEFDFPIACDAFNHLYCFEQ